MKLFKISDINLVEPFTVLAESRDGAADFFVACINRGFGHVPVIEYAVTGWNPKDFDQHAGLRDVVAQKRRVWAWEGQDRRWEFHNPFGIDLRKIAG